MRPSVSCATKQVSDNRKVSKLFRERGQADKEKVTHKHVSDIDPNGEFTVKLYEICDVPSNIFPDLEKCKNWEPSELSKDQIKQIVYEYGGVSLSRAARHVDPVILFKGFETILKGLIVLDRKGWAHLDIKPDNIVYNKDTNKMSLIDFGLSRKQNKIYTKETLYLREYEYPYYPPEFLLSVDHTKDIFTSEYFKSTRTNAAILQKANRFDYWSKLCMYTYGEVQKMNFKVPNRVFQPNKADVYAVGISMLEVLNVGNSKFVIDPAFLDKCFNLIEGMTHPDPTNRLDPSAAYYMYKQLFVKKATPQIMSPVRPDPKPVTIKRIASPQPP